MGARREKTAAMKMVHLRPKMSLMGSIVAVSGMRSYEYDLDNLPEIQAVNRAMAIYGQELTKPIIH